MIKMNNVCMASFIIYTVLVLCSFWASCKTVLLFVTVCANKIGWFVLLVLFINHLGIDNPLKWICENAKTNAKDPILCERCGWHIVFLG